MTPVRAKSNMLSLPCPKCRKPNPVESTICECGHTLVQQNAAAAAVAAPFPELRSILPELKKKPGNLRLVVPKEAKSESTGPDRPNLVEVSSSTFASPTFELPESRSGSSRLIYGVVFVGLILLTVAAAYLGGFIEVPSIPNQSAEPVQLAQSDVAPARSEEYDSKIENAAATAATEEQITDAPNETESVSETAVKTPSAKPMEKRVAGNVPKNVDSEPLTAQTTADTDKQSALPTPEKASANTAVAVARCGDGTYSYRKSASGTCAYRGGVAQWLDGTKPSSSPAKLLKVEDGRTYIMGSRGGCYYLTASGSKKYVDKSYCN